MRSFGAWAESRCGISKSTAYNLIAIATTFTKGDRESLSQSSTAEALYFLSRDTTPEDAITEAVERAEQFTHRTNSDCDSLDSLSQWGNTAAAASVPENTGDSLSVEHNSMRCFNQRAASPVARANPIYDPRRRGERYAGGLHVLLFPRYRACCFISHRSLLNPQR